MTTVYPLYHYNIGPDDDYLELVSEDNDKDEKLIGTFSSREKAEEVIRILREKPGFRDWPGGFRIMRSVLDEYAWDDGFISWDEAHGFTKSED